MLAVAASESRLGFGRGNRSECANCGHMGLHHGPEGCRWNGCECRRVLVALTRRELDVLMSFAGGCSAKVTATALSISVKTVESHRFSMMKKTGCTTTIQLVMAALRCGVVTLEDLPDLGLTIGQPKCSLSSP